MGLNFFGFNRSGSNNIQMNIGGISLNFNTFKVVPSPKAIL